MENIMKKLPKIALGAWAWGNDGTFGGSLTAETLRPIIDKAMENGLNLWDTAYAYGMGTSENVLAGFVKGLPRDSYLISDKFTPQCADGSSVFCADRICAVGDHAEEQGAEIFRKAVDPAWYCNDHRHRVESYTE